MAFALAVRVLTVTVVALSSPLALPLASPRAATPALAAPSADVTADILADRDVTLRGDAVVHVPAGTTTFTGIVRGEGTLTVAGTGRLIVTEDSDFTLPRSRQRQRVHTGASGDNYAVTSITDPDPPAVIVDRGATLQYGSGKTATGLIGHYPYQTPGFQLNGLNIRVDGTLDIAVHRRVNLGVISGSGFIVQRRFTWDGLSLQGAQPFSGVLYNGTGVDFGSPYSLLSMPRVKKVVNQGTAVVGVPTGKRLVISQDFYSREYGNDMNFNFPLSKRAVAVMTGVYSWADSGPDSNPSLSDPALNFAVVPHANNKRGINIEGSNVQWGDGTSNQFFLPGNDDTVYINLHTHRGVRGTLTFDYNGPTTLAAPISGGHFHDTMSAPGAGDVVIAATPGNAVTFAAPQNYEGSTTIGEGASLRLGTGKAEGDSGLLMKSDRCRVINNGKLTVANVKKAVALTRISGGGSFTQVGTATTTFSGQISYTGATRLSSGTLVLRGGASIARSAAVELTGAGAILDLTRAGAQTIRNLSGVAGTTVALRGNELTLWADESTVYEGVVGAGSVVKTGTGALTLAGSATASWTVRQGSLRVGDAGHQTASVRGPVTVATAATLSGTGSVDGDVSNAGTIETVPGGPLRITGDYTQSAGGALAVGANGLDPGQPGSEQPSPEQPSPGQPSPGQPGRGQPGRGPALTVAGTVELAGRLRVAESTPPRDTAPVTVIDNSSPTPVSGTFDGLAEGASLTVGHREYHISYVGGDGNDVVLTAVGGDGGGLSGVGLGRSDDGITATLCWAAIATALVAFAVVVVLVRRRRGLLRRVWPRGQED